MTTRLDPHAEPTSDSWGHEQLQPLVARALELRDEGREDWLAEACRAHPKAADAVLAAVERADSLPGWIEPGAEHAAAHVQQLGTRFRLLETIGAGAMGIVYLAEDLELRRKVACKVVHHGLMPPEQALERFAREAEAMAAVQHPAIVTIHDRGRTEGGQVYIVMELVEGVPLSAFLEAARVRGEEKRGDDAAWIEPKLGISTRAETSQLRTAVRWIADLANGLESVHGAGVLHRDIKPSNILLRRDGRPVLIDFGIALLNEQSGGTRTGTSVGTPAYMPLEALRRDAPRTPASDVYGLTATLYHLLTLHAPYEGTPNQILTQLATRDPILAARRRPGLPRDLQAILEKGMHRNATRRYATAAAFEADLRAFLEYRPVSARPTTAIERGLRRLVRSRVALGALVALMLVVLALGARAVREHARGVKRAEYTELMRHMPPNFSVVGPANREYRYAEDREALATRLDEAADVALEPLPVLLLRASFRQDHGDPDGAASDFRRIADYVGTPLARELATRYAAAATERHEVRGFAALVLGNLPESSSPTDRYLFAYHLMRAGGKDIEAQQMLGDPEVRRIPHAEELFIGLTDALPPDEQRGVAVERYSDVIRLEGLLGARTATTAHIAARMLTLQDRHEEALRVCADGIALAPRAYVLRINAGYNAFVLGQIDEAREHFTIARDLRPNSPHVLENLLRLEVAEGHSAAAAALVRDASPQLSPLSAGWVDYWNGYVAAYAALDAYAAGNNAERTHQLELARSCFERVPGRVLDDDDQPTDHAYRIANALEAKNRKELLLVICDLTAEKPHMWWRRRLLLRHLPTELDSHATSAVKGVLEALDKR